MKQQLPLRFKTFIKYALLSLGLLALAAVLGVWWLWSTLPTTAPQSISALPENTQITSACLQQHSHFAYQVKARVSTATADSELYSSELNFSVQLAARGEDALAGLAAHISISENQQPWQGIADVRFLAKALGAESLVFNAYNGLGLPVQHPMALLSQLLKNLSVGHPNEIYRFAYDEMQRIYRYQQHDGGQWLRTVSAPGQFNSQGLQPLWQVKVDGCLVTDLMMEEVQPITIGDESASLSFQIEAIKIDNFANLDNLDFSANTNAQNIRKISALELTAKKVVHNEQDAWQVAADFSANKNIQDLMQASQFLVEHVAAFDFAQRLQSNSSDNSGRDLLFGLGLLKTAQSAEYLIDVMQALPSGEPAVEMQKVRAMVALAGHVQGGENAYQAFSDLAENGQESPNIRNNALINMGATLKHMDERGEESQSLITNLNHKISENLEHNGSSALFAAANLGSQHLTVNIKQQAQGKLGSNNPKERFAAALVLSQDTTNFALLNQHLQQESSPLVKQAIIDGLEQAGISATQKAQLKH